MWQKKLIAMRLADNSQVYARAFKQEIDAFIVKSAKCISWTDGEKSTYYFDGETRIHHDAIESWAILHRRDNG